jgi:hypothetical protein
MLSQFGDIATALAAYNWGPGAVAKAVAQWGANFLAHAPGETQSYVAKIVNNLAQYKTTITPASIANGVTQILSTSPAPGDNTFSGFAILAAIGIGVYFLAEVFDD